jgi:uncharacterized protein (TIGR03437 family)
MKRSLFVGMAVLAATLTSPRSHAQTPAGVPLLTYVPSSSTKLEQVIGDCDWQAQAKQIVAGQAVTCVPTTSRTITRYNIAGNGQGGAFEANSGRMIFFFGDTISNDVSTVHFDAADPLAWSTSTDPEQGLLLNFYTVPSTGLPLFVTPPGIDMAGNNIPNSGITLNGQIYLICNTASSTTNPQSTYTILAGFDETAQTFSTGRQISPPGGKFIQTAMRASVSGSTVYIYGAGPYRASDIYLQMVPSANFASGVGTQYFAGMQNGQPTWTSSESGAVPVVQDNPLNGPAWPNDNPTVGNMSVVYSKDLNLWLMTYDGGRQPTTQSDRIRGIYFTYAAQPWGPWAPPQLIFNDLRDNAYGLGGFVHNPTVMPDPPGDGLNGPMIGTNNIYTSAGGSFAPLMIERFLTVAGSTLKVYYNISTWNPYTVVRMRSEFTITPAPVINTVANAAGGTIAIAPNTWVEINGLNLAPANDIRTWQNSDFVNNRLPTQLDGVSVTVNGKAAYVYYISPTQVNILTPPDQISSPVNVQLTNNGVEAAATAPEASIAPSFFVFGGGPYVAATHATGALIGPLALYPGSTTPAAPGEVVVLYGNGFGPTSTAVVSGSVTQSGTLTTMPVIKIGGINATVQFAGLVAPGEYQFNVQVPQNAADGDESITASYGGQTTQSGVTITIRH